ncbi:hypothetical protein [Roseobacter sp. HKCCA0434]|uniref:hypothetical protein n=1 Tax=Roseobacter sp. HKCCA0434 TaxID=3079297 RepID=UPI002905DB7A|nr:hypothetical protein [Roseobacter sp. HKCCA0434]
MIRLVSILALVATPLSAQISVGSEDMDTATVSPPETDTPAAAPDPDGIGLLIGDVWDWPPCPADAIREAYDEATDGFEAADLMMIEREVLEACQWRTDLVEQAIENDLAVREAWEEWRGAGTVTAPETVVPVEPAAARSEPRPEPVIVPVVQTRSAEHFRTYVIGGSGDRFIALLQVVEEIAGAAVGQELRVRQGSVLPGGVEVVSIDRARVLVRDELGELVLPRMSGSDQPLLEGTRSEAVRP